jgi:hypothetical protein
LYPLPHTVRISSGADADAPPRGVDGDAVDLDRPIAAGRLGLQLRSPRPPQQRARARHQLANAEGLGEVIVRAALEAEHLVAFLAARGQHQHRHVLVGPVAADGAADRHAVDPGQHQIQDDEVEALFARARERLLPVAIASLSNPSRPRCKTIRSRICSSSSTTSTRDMPASFP